MRVCAFWGLALFEGLRFLFNKIATPTFFNIFTRNFRISFLNKFGSYFIDRIFEFQIPENGAKFEIQKFGQ